VANFFLDNQDIQFLFAHLDLKELARIQEHFAENGPATTRRLEKRTRSITIGGCWSSWVRWRRRRWRPTRKMWTARATRLNADGTVTLNPKVRENLGRMGQADLMGFTLPRKVRGLELSQPDLHDGQRDREPRRRLVHEHVWSAGDCGDIYAFASQAIKDEMLAAVCGRGSHGAMV